MVKNICILCGDLVLIHCGICTATAHSSPHRSESLVFGMENQNWKSVRKNQEKTLMLIFGTVPRIWGTRKETYCYTPFTRSTWYRLIDLSSLSSLFTLFTGIVHCLTVSLCFHHFHCFFPLCTVFGRLHDLGKSICQWYYYTWCVVHRMDKICKKIVQGTSEKK